MQFTLSKWKKMLSALQLCYCGSTKFPRANFMNRPHAQIINAFQIRDTDYVTYIMCRKYPSACWD